MGIWIQTNGKDRYMKRLRLGNSIRSRIYFTVILIMVLFSAVSLLVFSLSAEWYARHMALRETGVVIDTVKDAELATGKFYPSGSNITKQEEKNYSRDLLKEARKELKEKGTDGELIVFNSSTEQVFPGVQTESAIPDDINIKCIEMIEEGRQEGIYVDGETGDRWYLDMYEAGFRSNVRAKYFFAAVRMIDAGVLKHYGALMLTAATILFIAISVLIVYPGAESISRPLLGLCRKVSRTGGGDDGFINDSYSLKELEQLKNSYNEMLMHLKSSEEEKNRIFQNVSHDLRTPLSVITGYAQGIKKGMVKDPEKAAGLILDESMRMNYLVESILTLTKIDNSDLKLESIKVELGEFIEEKLEAMEVIAGDISIVFDQLDKDIYVNTDPELLARILQNLLVNALRYAESRVTIGLEKYMDGAIINVEDDGPGFTEEDLEHAFDRFYQGKKGGFGIGLSVVSSGIDYLGGSISIGNREENGEIKGAVCTIYIPYSGTGKV